MSDIETAVVHSRRLEALLESQFAATGKGLHEKVTSVADKLPASLVEQLRSIATIRNKVVHEDGFAIGDTPAFVKKCESAFKQLGGHTANSGSSVGPSRLEMLGWKTWEVVTWLLVVSGASAAWYYKGFGAGVVAGLAIYVLMLLAVSDEAIAFYKQAIAFLVGLAIIGGLITLVVVTWRPSAPDTTDVKPKANQVQKQKAQQQKSKLSKPSSER